ncbi:MAG: hypothetical protein D6698_04870 [Gammaproteobacteria bacterium]|nr:MAG: hypothetical protein D6698_04870 [Gammaproteobacteria bacterium]
MSNDIKKVLAQSDAGIDLDKLENMESFTQDLFNRIIAFQTKEHPAWDASRPFSERIEGLSLHELIFSSPDRDPERYSHTIAPYYPLRYELRKLAGYIRQLNPEPVVLDYPCGNGFVGSLLAREGVQVIGVPSSETKPNQIDPFYDQDCYRRKGQLDSGEEYDAVFCSWMPAEKNLTPDILAFSPKIIVYVYTDHQMPDSSLRQVGSKEMFDGLDNYRVVEEWQVTRPENLLHECWPDLTPNIEEIRKVRVYALADVYNRLNPPELGAEKPYDWEVDLDMAMTVLEAKAFLRSRGIQL